MKASELTASGPDRWVTILVALLTLVGLVLVYSSSSLMNYGQEGQAAAGYFKKSLLFAGVGAVAFHFASRMEPERFRAWAYPFLVVSVVALCLVWMPSVGVKTKGAARWLRLGPLGFQPSEVAKFALVLFLAHSLSKRGDRVESFKYGFLPHMLIPMVPIGLVALEPDLGTAAVMAMLVFLVSFCGGVRPKHLAAAMGVAGSLGLCMILFVSFRMQRVAAFLDPWEHADRAGFQLVQSLMAFGEGGVWGVGLGAGRQKLHYLPEAHTDFILSIWAEECGLVGVVALLAAFAVLVWRGYRISLRQDDPYRRLLATGITTWLALQASLNALVVMGCLPTKGISFPFLSYGGSGLVVTLAAAGVLAGLGRRQRA